MRLRDGKQGYGGEDAALMKKGDNIVLIGMPGVGKSTSGVVVAKLGGYRFLDSDLLIQHETGKLLKETIAEEGLEKFKEIEGRVNAGIDAAKTVIATGGSVVYSEEAMSHLREIGVVVYLRASYETVCGRISNPVGRGIAMEEGMTLEDVYKEREPLYVKYADVLVDIEGETIEETAKEILRKVSGYGRGILQTDDIKGKI